MNDLTPMRGKVAALLESMRSLPQVGAGDIETTEHKADGMYCRVLFRRAGVTIVGKKHKKQHIYAVISGSVAITQGDREPVTHRAGSVFICEPGTQRAVVALEDSVCLTVHRTDKTDIEEIEAELVEPDLLCLYGPGNKLKELT